MDSGAAEQSLMRAVIAVNPVTTPAPKLMVNASLVMACGFACSSSAFIVPSHDSDRTSALAGKQMKGKMTNRIRDISATALTRTLGNHINSRRLKASTKRAAVQGRFERIATVLHPSIHHRGVRSHYNRRRRPGDPTRGTAPCCARTASGHATAAPPRAKMTRASSLDHLVGAGEQ
jgi:hypothetical protein